MRRGTYWTRGQSSSRLKRRLRLKSAEEFGIIEPFRTSLKQLLFSRYRHIHYAAKLDPPHLLHTVWLKSQTGCPILYCKRPIWRVGVWPKWVGPAHSTLGQSTPYTSRLTYSKMNHFCPVVLKWHTFVFLSSQLWLILLLSGWRVKYRCVPKLLDKNCSFFDSLPLKCV